VNVADTIPYAWPWDGALAGARLALVVAGASANWIERSDGGVAVGASIRALADTVRTAGGLVVHVDHLHHPDRRNIDRVGDAAGVAVPREGSDVVVTTPGIDGFYASDLDHLLRRLGRDQLALCGFGLEATIHSTMRSANDRGYECLLLTDACAPLDRAALRAALSIVTMSGGIFGALGTAGALAAALAGAPSAQSSGELPSQATSEVPT